MTEHERLHITCTRLLSFLFFNVVHELPEDKSKILQDLMITLGDDLLSSIKKEKGNIV